MLNRLRELRESHGYTLDYVAAKLGLRNQYISNYELGKRSPDYETLIRFAEFYGVSTDYLLGVSGSPASQPEDEQFTLLARHLERIPETQRRRILENFRDTLETYLEAMGLSENDDGS